MRPGSITSHDWQMPQPTGDNARFNPVLFTAPVILLIVGASILLVVPSKAVFGLIAIALAIFSAVNSVRRHRKLRRGSTPTDSL